MKLLVLPRQLTESLRNRLIQTTTQDDITDDNLLLIHELFGELTLYGLHLLERGSVILEKSKSGRQIYRLDSNMGTIHYCGYHSRFCSCFRGSQKRIPASYELWCEHYLTIFLAEILGRMKHSEMTNEMLTNALEMLYMDPKNP